MCIFANSYIPQSSDAPRQTTSIYFGFVHFFFFFPFPFFFFSPREELQHMYEPHTQRRSKKKKKEGGKKIIIKGNSLCK